MPDGHLILYKGLNPTATSSFDMSSFASGVTRLRKIWVDGGYEAQWLCDWSTA